MPKEFLFEIVVLTICLAVAVISLVLYLGEYKKRKDENGERSRIHNPFQELKVNEQKSFNILHRAIKKAQAIIGNAELEGIKVAAEDRMAAKFAHSSLEKEMSAQMNKAYTEYLKFLDGLKEQNTEVQATNQEIIKQRVDSIFDGFEQNLGTFLTSTEQKSIQSIELELRSARQLIETYKNAQMAIIDENIISILERTLTLVLAKKIPLKDQIDLVYEALNKAKVEKFVI